MSRFSFKAWDARNNKFLINGYHEPHYSISNDGNTVSIKVPTNHNDLTEALTVGKDVIVLFSTGLKDKNGVEIYEKDILSAKDGFKGVMEWTGSGFSAFLPLSSFEVIGNIYENPELLEDL